jgi:hypothetical protein
MLEREKGVCVREREREIEKEKGRERENHPDNYLIEYLQSSYPSRRPEMFGTAQAPDSSFAERKFRYLDETEKQECVLGGERER